jgi:hypothetical protein
VDGTSCGSCPIVGFSVRGIEPSGSYLPVTLIFCDYFSIISGVSTVTHIYIYILLTNICKVVYLDIKFYTLNIGHFEQILLIGYLMDLGFENYI